ncbi:MAG: hypothetical protein LC136_15025 [Burkholderiales bacterium]|nr:hypothetical protein [Burkholderiales bacterium]
MSRLAVGLLVALLAASAHAATVAPVVPCDRPIMVFGEATVLARGVRIPGSNDLVSRLRVFFRRVCHREPLLEVFAHEHGRLVDDEAAIRDYLGRKPGALVFVHYPYTDIESGVSVDALLDAYRRISEACRLNKAICILGGQQPVEALSRESEARQLELERRASVLLGSEFLPLYRYFQSETATRRLMMPLDSGDGRLVNDEGHEALFELYRRHLIESTSALR